MEGLALDDQGFRIRREQPTRVEGFVDAAFAFAVTLLVVSVGNVPTAVAQMMDDLRGVPAFLAGFLLIARFWQSHRQWSRRFGIEDDYSVRLSLALVFVILIFVYPLRMIAAIALAGFSGGWLHSGPAEIASVGELRELYVVFAVAYGVIVGLFALLYRHALACGEAIGLAARERRLVAIAVRRNLGFLGIAVLSMALAWTLPMDAAHPLLFSLPGMIYALAWPLSTALARSARRVQTAEVSR